MNMGYTLAAILVSALCTLALRALPFLCFGKNRPVPSWLTRLGQALPPAIMAVLVIYCLREGFEKPLSAGIPLLAGTALVFFSYRWKHNTLLSIALGTAGYMLALRLL